MAWDKESQDAFQSGIARQHGGSIPDRTASSLPPIRTGPRGHNPYADEVRRLMARAADLEHELIRVRAEWDEAQARAAALGAIVEAADSLYRWLRAYRGVCEVNALRNGNGAEIEAIGDALDAYRAARAGRDTMNTGE